MKSLIKLTVSKNGKTLFINTDFISSMVDEPDTEGHKTTIAVSGEEGFYGVEETVDEIIELIKKANEEEGELND